MLRLRIFVSTFQQSLHAVMAFCSGLCCLKWTLKRESTYSIVMPLQAFPPAWSQPTQQFVLILTNACMSMSRYIGDEWGVGSALNPNALNPLVA